jgi:hypothetical protein
MFVREALIGGRLLRPRFAGGEPLVRPARGPVFAFLGVDRSGSSRSEAVDGASRRAATRDFIKGVR